METVIAKRVIDRLVQDISVEINSIKCQVANDMIMQVAIYAHDHIGAKRPDFGMLSDKASLTQEYFEELDRVRAALLDREQRRNALKHLRYLVEEGNETAMHLLQRELSRFFREDETYAFLLEPELEYPNEHVKPYPYTG